MEAGLKARPLLLILGLVLALRLPFLNQAVQGDDPVYLTEASHALVEPLHPDHTGYVFRGRTVDLRGLTHPPLDGWTLAGLLAVFGSMKELPFHTAYMAYSLIAAASMWSLARRFSANPLWATLLFLAVPVFVVNGTSFETDVPFAAFWMAAIALFCADRLALAALAMVLASLTAYQTVVLIPILAVYCWLFRRHSRAHWLVLLTPAVIFVAWQAFERISTGALPAGVLSGYFTIYQTLQAKLVSALALSVHFWFLIFPALVPFAFLLAWRNRRQPETQFLVAWIVIFFGSALVIFFAGSARYLLPMAAPMAMLAAALPRKWLVLGFALQMALSLGLAVMNYQQWDAYRVYAASLAPVIENHRVWVDDEWGLRHYMQERGALPLQKIQRLRADDIIVSSQLSHAVEPTALLATAAPALEIRPAIPLRIIGLESHSGYSSAAPDRLWPFGISAGVIDRVRASRVVERHPTLSYVDMKAPEAKDQIVSGIWPDDHWMTASGVVMVKSPAAAMPLAVSFFVPDNAPARHIALLLDDREVCAATVAAPGPGELRCPAPIQPNGATAMIEIRVDKTFRVPPDERDLGIVLLGVGFK
jgi:Dolichyl-phosphate-mannose-protein mannosyltransferase